MHPMIYLVETGNRDSGRSITVKRKFIGVDVGGTSVKLGTVDGKGRVLDQKEVIYSKDGDRHVMDAICESIRGIAEENGGISGFAGIGVSAAGCINSVKGCVAGNGGNIPDWSRTEVCSILRKEFGIPATLANDANCAILGELWTGAARGYSEVLGFRKLSEDEPKSLSVHDKLQSGGGYHVPPCRGYWKENNTEYYVEPFEMDGVLALISSFKSWELY